MQCAHHTTSHKLPQRTVLHPNIPVSTHLDTAGIFILLRKDE